MPSCRLVSSGMKPAVFDRLDPGFRYDLGILIDKLQFEHDEWVR